MWRRRLIFSQHQHQHQSTNARTNSNRNNHTTRDTRYDAFDYCVNLVRQRDRESYLCTLVLPADVRLSVFAVRAFNVELSSIRAMVSGQSTALARYHFWSSALEKIFNENRSTRSRSSSGTVISKSDGSGGESPTVTTATAVPEHPVAQALEAAVKDKQLSRKWLSELIDGRVDRIDERRAFRTIKELEDFYQRIFGSVLFLTLECANVRQVNADHAASHLGKALGLVNGLRSISVDPERNLHLLPLELLLHHRVSQEDVLRLAMVARRGRSLDGGDRSADVQKRIRDLVFDVASQAHVHLECARKSRKEEPFTRSTTRLILLPAAIVDHYLGVLRKVDFELFNHKFVAPYNWLPIALWWRNCMKTY